MKPRSWSPIPAPALLSVAFVLASPATAKCASRVTQIETPLGCVNTVVTVSRDPTGPAMVDGGHMEFRTEIARGIKELYVPPGDVAVAHEGERVRVCLLNVPKKGNGCDPAKDGRGREFLVYVYTNDPDRQSDNAFVYTNAEHWCGGA